MAKSKKDTQKTAVKVQDLTPAKDPKGGSKILQASNDMKKAIIANFRV